MACNPENNVLSKVELVLPRNVIETCYMLPLGVGANFISTNITRATMTKIHVYKGNDESVKISVTVSAIQITTSIHPQHILVQNVKRTPVVDAANVLSNADYIMTIDSLDCDPKKVPNYLAPSSPTIYPTDLLASAYEEALHVSAPSEIFADDLTKAGPDEALASALLGVTNPPTDISSTLETLDSTCSPTNMAESGLVHDNVSPLDSPYNPENMDDSSLLDDNVESLDSPYNPENMDEPSLVNENVEKSCATTPLEALDSPYNPENIEDPSLINDTVEQACATNSVEALDSTYDTESIDDPSLVNENAQKPCAAKTVEALDNMYDPESIDEPSLVNDNVEQARATKNPEALDRVYDPKSTDEPSLVNKNVAKVCAATNPEVLDATNDPENMDEASLVNENVAQPSAAVQEPPKTPVVKPSRPARRKKVPLRYRLNKDNSASADSQSNFAVQTGSDGIRGFEANDSPKKPPRVNFEVCPICNADCKDLEAVSEHLQDEHDDSEEVQQHLVIINKKIQATCNVCHEVFKSQRLMNIHLVKVHVHDTEVKCDRCGITVGSVLKLDKHRKQCHQSKERFLCHLCPSSFKLNCYLNAHLSQVHNSKKDSVKCDLCDKTYATAKYLYNHKLRVHGQKRHVCSYCGKAFTNNANMDRHVLLAHERTKIRGFTCPFCERFFSLKFNMTEHIKTIHRQEFSHQCELCGAGFRRSTEVETHVKTIHGDSKEILASPVRNKPGRPRRTASKKSKHSVMAVLNAAAADERSTDSDLDFQQEFSNADHPSTSKYIIATPQIIQVLGIEKYSG